MMETLAPFHFLRPGWLLLAPVAAAIWWRWRLHSDALRGWREQMDPELLDALVIRGAPDTQANNAASSNGRGDGSRAAGSMWLLATWLIGIIAVAGPTWRLEPNPFAGDAQPLMVLLKADQSMERSPPSPSWMEQAQLKIADLAEARMGQPLGLIAYAGSAHLVLPPTVDTKIVAKMAAEVNPSIMPTRGDRLDLAIEKALQLLGDEGGSLLIVADSAELDPQLVSAALGSANAPPIQFLALADSDATESESIQALARELHADVQPRTPDGADIDAIVSFSERRAARGIAGESSRWQEFGYWLTPLLAWLSALSFRREAAISTEDPS